MADSPKLPVLLRKLKDHPALPVLLPSLPPRALTRLYTAVGMNDAGSLMALTPVDLLVRALDEAVWARIGTRTRFDPDVFVDWLEVWNGEGEAFTAERLAALDEDSLTLCFSELLRVEDSHATAFSREPGARGGEFNVVHADLLHPDASTEQFDRFLVGSTRDDEWNVVHEALLALWTHHPDRLLALLERLAAGERPPSGLAPDSVLHQDAAAAREARQERAGFVAPSAAQAFLATAVTLPAAELLRMSAYDLETNRHLAQLRAAGEAATPRGSPTEAPGSESPEADPDESAADDVTEAPADPELWTLLASAGIVDATTPAGLLAGPGSGPDLILGHRLEHLAATDSGALADTAAELAYLANVLLAGLDLGSSFDQPEDEARNLAFATTNLGLELLAARGIDVTLGEAPGLVRPFLVAWRALVELPHRLVHAFEAALSSPAMTGHLESRQWLHAQMQESLSDLREAVRESRFEAGRESLGLLSLAFEANACRAAAHLLGQPPRFPGLLEGGDKDAARWMHRLDDLGRVSVLLANLRPKG